jgi:hypothetical protein
MKMDRLFFCNYFFSEAEAHDATIPELLFPRSARRDPSRDEVIPPQGVYLFLIGWCRVTGGGLGTIAGTITGTQFTSTKEKY